ncbi:MAG: hypothetical protein Q4C10_12350 [Clostridia bacterium]|nr:hypothetical protein [Clostridia bacterium]
MDTGASHLFAQNAECLGIDLNSVDTGVLSHAHYDHADGMTYFMEYYLDMLVMAVDDRRERERIRQQRREELERMSLEQEREMAKQPLASPGSQGQAEPLEDEPEDEPEEMTGEDDPSGGTAEGGNEAAIMPGDDAEDAIMSRIRAAVTEQSSEKKECVFSSAGRASHF